MVISFGALEVNMNYKTGKITVSQKGSTSEAQQVPGLVKTVHKKMREESDSCPVLWVHMPTTSVVTTDQI